MTGLATAVVPVFNGRELLGQLLDSIAVQTLPFAEVIVVDNGSTDGAPDLAASHGCRVLPMGCNAGFAKAVNTGWRASSTQWVAILNSDVVLEPGWLEQCLKHANTAAFATGKLLQAAHPESLDGTYDLVSRAGCAWRAGHGHPDGADGVPVKIGIAPGTACLFRKEVLSALHGYTETFESYMEDVDLGLRCVRAGHHGVYVPSARATHRGSATFGAWSPRVVRLISRNQVLLVRMHYDWHMLRLWWWHVLCGQALWGMLAIRHHAGCAWLRGKVDGLRQKHLSGTRSAALAGFIERAEDEIRTRATGPYWRWYFRLTGPVRRIDT